MTPPTKTFPEFQQAVYTYLPSLTDRTEATRRQRFLELLRDFFGIEADELEKTLQVGGVGARVAGRIDALAGNVILEFKKSLTGGNLLDAKTQLHKYAMAFAAQGDSRRYTLIASDGEEFQAFYWDGISAALTESTTRYAIQAGDWEKGYYWLDDWIASKIGTPAAPTGAAIARKLGTQSPSYLLGKGLLEAEWKVAREEHQAAYREWEKSIIYVYGSNLATPELFLRHSYVTTVAKVLMAAAIIPDQVLRKQVAEDDARGIVLGDLFRRYGILNIGERDFFAWLAETKGGIELTRGLLAACTEWDFHQVSDDLLRDLYEELIDPETRHDLGEFYTPPWVAQLLVEEALDSPELTVLDPACGSGTFLVAAIMRKVEQGRPLEAIIKEVVGIDIHPVAVTVARASYLLALRSMLRGRSGTASSFRIPIYLSDSIRPREPRFRSVLEAVGSKVKYFELTVIDENEKASELSIPAAAVEGAASEAILDAVESAVKDGTWSSIEGIAKREFRRVTPDTATPSLELLEVAFNAIQNLHSHGRNGIHVFLLRNYFQPTLLAGTFDRVIGNPPWLAFRYLRDSGVQRSVKEAYREEHLMPVGGGSHLITQLDIAPLFFARCGEKYLRPGGKIRFLLPRTVFNSDQFSGFRSRPSNLVFDRTWDLARVRPLFTVQCCAVGAVLGPVDRTLRDPIPTNRWEGNLSDRLVPLTAARSELRVTTTTVSPIGELYNWTYPEQDISLLESGKSVYHSAIQNGATIYPYPLVFVDVAPDPTLGLDPRNPSVRTGARALRQAKKPWKSIVLTGSVEARFLFSAITGSEVLPFGHLPLPVAALPLVPGSREVESAVLDSDGLSTAGAPNMAQFFGKAEAAWKLGHETGKKGTGPFRNQIDYRRKLSTHPLSRGYFVVLPTSARLVLACVVPQAEGKIPVNGNSIPTQGTIVECTNNYLFTASKQEAHYLCAILNSGPVNNAVKAPVHKGLDTERHTYREPLAVPIPKFDSSNRVHVQIALLGEECSSTVERLLKGQLKGFVEVAHVPSKLAALRSAIREELKGPIVRIDTLTAKLLKVTQKRRAKRKPRIDGTRKYRERKSG